MKRKRVLLVTSEFPPQPGGIGNHAYNLAKQLDRSGYTITVLSDARSMDGLEEKSLDQLLSFQVLRVAVKKFRFLMYFKRVFLLFRHVNASDVVVASGKFLLWVVVMVSFFY